MAEFVLNRNHTLAALGHRITFVKGQPTWVPPALAKLAAAIGAECADGPVDPLDPEKAPEAVPLTAEERIVELTAAIKAICEKNDSSDFSGDGRPSLAALHKVVPFTTSKKELGVAWQAYKDKQAE
jgi:hypothetical protein